MQRYLSAQTSYEIKKSCYFHGTNEELSQREAKLHIRGYPRGPGAAGNQIWQFLPPLPEPSPSTARDVGHCPALPLAFHLGVGPWTLKQEINAVSLFQWERMIHLSLKLLALELKAEFEPVCVNNPTITTQRFCLDCGVCGATFSWGRDASS